MTEADRLMAGSLNPKLAGRPLPFAPRTLRSQILLCCLVAIVLSCAINGGSLWIDEGFSAYLSSQRTFAGMLSSIRAFDSGDLQTIGYYAYLWLWVHLFGHGEIALRASNLPFVAMLCASFAALAAFTNRLNFWWPVCLLSPFIWTYINEARVYLPLLACSGASLSAALICAVCRDPKIQQRARIFCVVGIVLTVALDILGVLVIPAVFLAVFLLAGKRARLIWLRSVPILLLFLAGEGAYYLWTLFQPTYQPYDMFKPAYVGLFAYEFLGLQGIGPSRNQLRLLPASSAIPGAFTVAVAVGFISLIAIAVIYLRSAAVERKQALRILSVFLVCLATLFLIGVVLKVRFLPRHGSAVYPAFLLSLSIALAGATLGGRRRLVSICLVFLCLVWLLSDARLRFLPKYQKDDYRSAVLQASELRSRPGAEVIWMADYATASYYGLRLSDPFNFGRDLRLDMNKTFELTGWPERASAVYGVNMRPEQVQEVVRNARQHGRSLFLCISKPDLYDRYHAWSSLLTTRAKLLTTNVEAFTFYQF